MGGATPATAEPLHGRRPAASGAAAPGAPIPTLPAAEIVEAPPGPGVQLRAAGLTHPGRVRRENEDALLARVPDDSALRSTRGALFAIADGVGGQAAGEVASRTAVEHLEREYFSPRAPHQTETALSQATVAANLAVHALAHGSNPGLHAMQTTLTVLVFSGRQLYIAHAGDTRAYLLRAGALTQLTGDHSEAAEMLRLRLITAEQALTHPRRSVLTRALGATAQLRPDFQRSALQRGDRFLICTDGLWADLPTGELREALAVHPDSPAATCELLLATALERGGSDNVSLYVIDIIDPGAAAPNAPTGRIGRLLSGLRGGG